MLTRFNIQNHLHCLLPERHHAVQPGEIEVVLDELLADFAEVFMTW